MSDGTGLSKLTWLCVGLAISLLSNAVMGGALIRTGKQDVVIATNTKDIVAVREKLATLMERIDSFGAGQVRIEALVMALMVQGKLPQ